MNPKDTYTCTWFYGSCSTIWFLSKWFSHLAATSSASSKPSKVEDRTSGILMIFGLIVGCMAIAIVALGTALWVTWMGSVGPKNKKQMWDVWLKYPSLEDFRKLNSFEDLWGWWTFTCPMWHFWLYWCLLVAKELTQKAIQPAAN